MDHPDTPDFWRLSDLIRALDAQANLNPGYALREELSKHVDPESAEYVALQRALRLAQKKPDWMTLVSALTAMWLEGFVCGRRLPEPEDATP